MADFLLDSSRLISLPGARYDTDTRLLTYAARLLPFTQNRRSVMKHSPYLLNGCPKSCEGCGQPFPIREGRVEAQVGQDLKLYCYGLPCEADALEAAAMRRKRAS